MFAPPVLPTITSVYERCDASTALNLPCSCHISPRLGSCQWAEGCSPGKCQICLHTDDDTNPSRKFLSALALDGDSKSLFCLRTGCWHLLSECQLYSCLPQNFVTSRGARPPLPDGSGTGSSCSLCSFSLFFDRSAASGRSTWCCCLIPTSLLGGLCRHPWL